MVEENIQGGASKKRTWAAKFGDAFRGVRNAIPNQSSFLVHFCMTAAVVVCGVFFGCQRWEWCILLLCITIVLAAETFNSALEAMGRAVDREYNPQLGKALDMASGAVLICAMGAAVVGCAVFGPHLWALLAR